MTSSIRWISVDCADPYPLSRFYGAVTGWATDDEDRPGDGRGWVVLADPEGNEFCMNTSPAERDTAQ